jgi:hypothetical protein
MVFINTKKASKKSIVSLLFLIIAGLFSPSFLELKAQDTTFAREVIMQLGSPEMAGRAYELNGNLKAAKYISQQFESFNLQQYNNQYFQSFDFPINTIKKLGNLKVDGQLLQAGSEFFIAKSSASTKGRYQIDYITDSLWQNDESYRQQWLKKDLSHSFLVIDNVKSKLRYDFPKAIGGLIFLRDEKLGAYHFSHAQTPVSYAILDILNSAFPINAKEISINFKSKFEPNYPTQNVIAYVKGKAFPDSILMIGAHYDHLGTMGKSVYFPGGNDNASGVAMVLDLANYFSKPANQPDFTIVFALFTGEEVGLLGSFYMANNPPFNLSQVKMMLNLDMVGTGSTGFVVVNARKFQSQFDELDSINQSNNYVKEVKARGESCNSDHCPFYIKGVPAFFIYTTGDEYKEYHTTTDLPQRVPLTNYNGVFKILRTYLEEI